MVDRLSEDDAKLRAASLSKAKSYGALTALGIAAAIIPNGFSQALGFLFILGFGCHFFFHGATAICIDLHPSNRFKFQVAAIVIFQLMLSSIFLIFVEIDKFSLDSFFAWFSWWSLLPIGIISMLALGVGDQLNRRFPFRQFIVVAALLVVPFLAFQFGVVVDREYGTDDTVLSYDRNSAAIARSTGKYFLPYLVCCLAAYTAIFAQVGYKIRREEEWLRQAKKMAVAGRIAIIERHRKQLRQAKKMVAAEREPGSPDKDAPR